MKPEATLRTVIIAAVEPTAASDQVIHAASSMSRVVPGAELHFVHVIDAGPPPHSMALSLTDLVAEGRTYLDGVIAQATPLTQVRVSGHLTVGAAVPRILQIATDIGADLIVVGTHEKRGIARMLGSVSHKILMNARCPVLLARVKEKESVGPEIEPACPDCVNTQFASKGEKLWCARHATRHVHGHLHYGVAEGYGSGSMFVHPDA